MHSQDIVQLAVDCIAADQGNVISKNEALAPELEGMRLFDAPLVGFGAAEDACFDLFKQEGIVGPHFKKPTEWLPDAATVVAFFLPVSHKVRRDNARDMRIPSPAWLLARTEGQALMYRMISHVREAILTRGHAAVVPSLSQCFAACAAPATREEKTAFTSNWSERHVAFACGLGTFGLSRGLITKRGVAGRFVSLITNLRLPIDTRPYTGVYEYCLHCGACAKNCPAKAISIEKGKDQALCSQYLEWTKTAFAPHYGCGKCQVNVPCESGIGRHHG